MAVIVARPFQGRQPRGILEGRMAAPLPRLRPELDLMPSPLPEQPGLVIRDPFRYSTATLVVPPLLARCLGCFDGRQDEGDLRATLVRVAGRVSVGEAAKNLVKALREAGFLEDERFAELRAARLEEIAASPERPPAHAGGSYPAEPAPLTEVLRGYFGEAPPDGAAARSSAPVRAIAAPHVSPFGGSATYARAYGALPVDSAPREKVFVILGTSHYGEPDRYGLTRKPFATPFGKARTEIGLVDALIREAPGAVTIEDPCHFVEHAIEFQVVFLQYLFGPAVRIVPVLCGAFADGPGTGRHPEANDQVARFAGALGELAARRGDRLSFVLGVDFAHVGRRYGDELNARANVGPLAAVAARDRARVERIGAGDADGFWELVTEGGDDDLKWCGTSPIYTFLRALPEARGRLLGYDQWNIDEASVVSFGAMSFPEKERA
jgi:AmmeMemoRadiSam system protein B